jgi:hypothetical protein
MNDFLVCVPYFSLPEFPEQCILVSIRDILPRDILLSNPSNSIHRTIGVQFDPAIECSLYRVCEPRVRQSIRARLGIYDRLFILFRTTYRKLDGSSNLLIAGYYEVDKNATAIAPDDRVLARRMSFVSTGDAVDITQLMSGRRAYRSAFSSENEAWKAHLYNWKRHLEANQNRLNDYILLINNLKSAFEANEFRNSRYRNCLSCKWIHNDSLRCPLVYRQNHWSINDLSRYDHRILPCP